MDTKRLFFSTRFASVYGKRSENTMAKVQVPLTGFQGLGLSTQIGELYSYSGLWIPCLG